MQLLQQEFTKFFRAFTYSENASEYTLASCKPFVVRSSLSIDENVSLGNQELFCSSGYLGVFHTNYAANFTNDMKIWLLRLSISFEYI
jgi:hypothetical protein